MWTLIFSGMLVGLPAGFGAYVIVDRSKYNKPATGFMFILYAFVLGGFISFFLPEGKLMPADFQLKMPGVFILGCLIGVLVGLWKRRRSD